MATSKLPKDKPVGICPACGEAVYKSRETDGPVWTCPADLSTSNPYWEPPLPPFDTITEAERERLGYFGNCCENISALGTCYDHLPLHGTCHDKGDY